MGPVIMNSALLSGAKKDPKPGHTTKPSAAGAQSDSDHGAFASSSASL